MKKVILTAAALGLVAAGSASAGTITGFYSVLAGFVEPGETLEACVEREIAEEVGITVKEIRYFGSQPWPFPDSRRPGRWVSSASASWPAFGRRSSTGW